MADLPIRRPIRLRGFDYREPGAYFVTVCTFRRECLFGDVVADRLRPTAVAGVVESVWRAIPIYFSHVDLDAFVVMPNHVHGVLWLRETRAKHPALPDASPLQGTAAKGTRPGSLPAVIQTFKAISTRGVHALAGMDGIKLWQRGFYDRVIRNDEELNRIRAYIEQNPLRWALDGDNPAGPMM